MKTVGIVAEYNPFHNGHLYQINQVKKITNADYVIVVMSGNFVQRGNPAILDKYARTKMALKNNVDAVFEIPVCYATASAEYFAYGAVNLLQKLGVVDYLCFGSECADLPLMKIIADYLIEEPSSYKEALLRFQKSGETYPKARALAISETLSSSSYSSQEISEVLTSPNNILGIEYLKALSKLGSTIQPITIRREGASYHSEQLNENNPSATAIRKHIIEANLSLKASNLPSACIDILTKAYQHTCPITPDDFSSLLYYQLLMKANEIATFQDVSDDLSNRIQKLLTPALSFTSFAQDLKTKQLTATRIQRTLLHILLNLKQTDFDFYHSNQIMYARLLGFRKTSSTILREIQTRIHIPFITKVADAKALMSENEYSMFSNDIHASHIYNQVVYSKFSHNLKDEYTVGPVII